MGSGASTLKEQLAEASPEDIKKAFEALPSDAKDKVKQALDASGASGAAAKGVMIFQLGTNNWQSEEEPAPGSGILHEAQHIAFNNLPDSHSYSVYPSSVHDSNPNREKVKVVKLPHKIPICESISPVSDKRWHSMSDTEVEEYLARLEQAAYDQMALGEAETGRTYDFAIAHHCFLNQVVMQRVIKKRVDEGKAKTPLVAFSHGTALKMFNLEVKGDPEYPMRFKTMMDELKVFDDIVAVLAISEDNKKMFLSHFPNFNPDNILVNPPGFNPLVFHKTEDTIANLSDFSTVTYEDSGKDVGPIPADKYKKMLLFVGKFADWKRLDMVLKAAKQWEAKYPDVCTVIAGTGQPADVKLYHKMAFEEIGLAHTYFVGSQMQPNLARLFTMAEVGLFPSKSEPFGLVFIECMTCGTPVIGANSGGPKDFITEDVGFLIPDEELAVPANDKLVTDLFNTVCTALEEDWKGSKSENCRKLAERYSVNTQVGEYVERIMGVLAKQ